MSKIAVVFWSGTGNTEIMAQHVAEGAKSGGAEVYIYSAVDFDPESVDDYRAIAFGCPSMGDEELEDSEFLPMFDACKPKLKDKKIGLFGSYGWGDGEWMRNWETECNALGGSLIGEGIICVEEPDTETQQACFDMGEILSE